MKSSIIAAIVFTAIFTIPATYLITKKVISKKEKKNTISIVPISSAFAQLNDVKACIDRWDSLTSSNNFHLTCFTIKATDVLAAVGIDSIDTCSVNAKYDHLRAYIGLDNNLKYKLYFVPVAGCRATIDSQGNCSVGSDLYLDKLHDNITISAAGNNALDVNMPCPSFCNYTSRVSFPIKKK